ncbi:MAG: carboxypeptidase-like regulatory domain-containing protein, partial [Methanothrix sp.]|nr:carboxypeptidase-like regulatory domain-containing protein [Methanothrix sp.]
MKDIKKVTILVLAIFTSAVAYPQTIIRGRVIDSKERIAVIGANVIEYDRENRTINGTVCDVNGDFVLEMKNPDNTVKVVMIGYKTKPITPGAATSITIELEPSSIQLGEVVVT